MGRTFDAIPDHLADWMGEQPVYFVATAPLAADGHVNVSPKGGDTFRVLAPTEVAYLDLTGSGAETIAHTRENGRLTIMFCSFDAKPLILRLYGRGTAVLPGRAGVGTSWRPGSPPRPAPAASSASPSSGWRPRAATPCPTWTWSGPGPRWTSGRPARAPTPSSTTGPRRTRASIDGLPALDGAPATTP